ncbi:MAG: ABC transporter ATP-binding protein [Beijerinckiaceae bacterium]
MPGDALDIHIDAKIFRTNQDMQRAVLRNVVFSVARGNILALFGPSGTGKTTTLRIAMGLDADFEGTVIRPTGRLGVMFQEPRLAPWLNVADNLRLVVTEGVPEPDIPAILNEVGLPGAEKRFPRELSLGMARRAALARALAVEPNVLVLDEPFASLDRQLAATLTVRVRRWVRRTQATVLLATHDLEQVLGLADRILVLSGSPATLAADVIVPSRTDPATMEQFRAALVQQFPFLGGATTSQD